MACPPPAPDGGGTVAFASMPGTCYRRPDMPKSRIPRRSNPLRPDAPETPDRAEVERAVAAVLDRLKPGARRTAKSAKAGVAKVEPAKPESVKPARKPRPAVPLTLTLVPGRKA